MASYKVFLNKDIITESSSDLQMTPLWDKIWKLKVPGKIKHFLWKALNNSLPTKLNIIKKGIDAIPLCPNCHKCVESVDHTLFSCSHASEIWDLV